jgi:hypothetical protein
VRCAECGTVDERAESWRAYRSDPPPEAEPEDQTCPDVTAVVVFCAACSFAEFGDGLSDW